MEATFSGRSTASRGTRVSALLLVTLLVGSFLPSGLAGAEPNEATTPVSTDFSRRITAGGLHSCAVLDTGEVQCWGGNTNGQLGNDTTATSTVPKKVSGVTAALNVSAGATHTCALVYGGTVRCWGNNGSGQLGNGTTSPPAGPALAPVDVLFDDDANPATAAVQLSDAVAIAAGGFHTCALRATGSAVCWGHDGSGQLGIGGGTGTSYVAATVKHDHDSNIVTPLQPLMGISALAAGEYHTCALMASDGGVKCWGHNGFGQLGNGVALPGSDKSSAVAVSNLPEPDPVPGTDPHRAIAISAGQSHTCAVLDDNTARCWGQDFFGQLGNNASGAGTDSSTPVKVTYDQDGSALTTDDIETLDGVVGITAGQFHTCARRSTSTVRCWGQNGRGQLGDNTTTDRKTAVPVSGLSGVRAVTAGAFHNCALLTSNTIRCWGYNFYGQLGAYQSSSHTPVTVTALSGATTVSVGDGHACALVTGADVPAPDKPVCWGHNASGELGAKLMPSPADSRIPVDVFGIADAATITAGNDHTCALVDGSAVPRCWGRNVDGELGNGTNNPSDQPVNVSSITTATHVSSGGRLSGGAELGTSCARLSDSSVWCWGDNTNGQLGDNAVTLTDRNTPVRVTSDHDNDHLNTPDPAITAPVDLTGAATVAVGGSHACAVMSDTKVRCWGANGSGQLGDGTKGERRYAVTVDTDADEPEEDESDLHFTALSNVVEVTAGAAHTCARKSDNTVWCWGANSDGQLGDGTFAQRDVPVQVQGIPSNVIPLGIAAGDIHTCGRFKNTSSGHSFAMCWGDDDAGTLGDVPGGDWPYPVVPEGLGEPGESSNVDLVKAISAGRSVSCAALIDSTVSCWGDNAHGQLGDGVGSMRKTPIAVGGLGSVGGNKIPAPQDDSATTAPSTPVVVPVLANDTDPDNAPSPLTVLSATHGTRGTTTVNAGPPNTITYAPNADFCSADATSRTDTFTYEVTDGTATVPAEVTITVTCPNTAPSAVADSVTTNEEMPAAIDVVANDSDPNGQAVTVSAGSVSAPANGTALLQPDNKTVLYTPNANFTGTDTFTYQATDGIDASAPATVTITVHNVNDPPVATDDSATTAEDTAVTFEVVANDTDVEGSSLAISSVSDPVHGTAVAGTPTTITYTPDPGYCNTPPGGTDSFTYDVSDGGSVDTAVVNVTVNCQNDGPNATDDAATTQEDSSVLIDVLANDTDPEGDTLTIAGVTTPAHGTAAIESGKVRYTPTPDFCGLDTFGYTAEDGNGGSDSAVVVPVAVVCTNDAPVANDDAASVPEDGSTGVDVLANDTDPDLDELKVASVADPAHGTASVGATNVVTYKPDVDFCGTDSFGYTASDASGATAGGTVTVSVGCVEDAPVLAAIGDQTGRWGDAVSITLHATDADAGDPDPATSDTVTFSLVSAPAGATIVEPTPASFAIAWTPTAGQVGNQLFTVRASDGSLHDDESFAFAVTKRPTMLVYSGDTSGQYSDAAAVEAKLLDYAFNPVTGASVGFKIGTRSSTATTATPSGIAAGNVVLDGPAGAATVETTFAGDAAYLPSSLTSSFTVLKETVAVALTGRHLTITTGTSATASLSATVAEEADGSLGTGIATLQVDFTDLSGAVLCTGAVSLTSAGQGTASCSTASLPLGSRAVVAKVRGASYAGHVDVGAFALAQAPAGSASGGGRLIDPADGSTADFAFRAVPPAKKGAAPTGDAMHVRRAGGVATVVRTTSLTGLSTSCSGGKTKVCSARVDGASAARWAVDVASGAVTSLAGTSSLRLDATDVAEPGSGTPADRYAVVLTGADTYSLGTPANQLVISAGNIRVPS